MWQKTENNTTKDNWIKFLLYIIVFTTTLIIYMLGWALGMAETSKKLEYILNYSITDYIKCLNWLEENINYDIEIPNKKDIREKVRKEIPVKFVIEINGTLSKGYSGFTLVPFRLVIIRKDLTGFNYCETLTHEYVHLYEYNSNERYTTFRAIQILIESNDEFLHQCGLVSARDELRCGNDPRRINGEDYTCNYQLIEYLKDRYCII